MRQALLFVSAVTVLTAAGCTIYGSGSQIGVGGCCDCNAEAPATVVTIARGTGGYGTQTPSGGSLHDAADASADGGQPTNGGGHDGGTSDGGPGNGGNGGQCKVNQDCASDEDCVANICLERCHTSCDCHEGLTCQSGYCEAPAPPGATVDGGSARMCVVNQDCAAAHDCVGGACLLRCQGVCGCTGGLACVGGYCE